MNSRKFVFKRIKREASSDRSSPNIRTGVDKPFNTNEDDKSKGTPNSGEDEHLTMSSAPSTSHRSKSPNYLKFHTNAKLAGSTPYVFQKSILNYL